MTGTVWIRFSSNLSKPVCVSCVQHLSISKGDQLMVHAKITPEWWWAELRGVFGYVPASYLRQGASEEEEEKEKEEDAWQDEEYYSTYGTLVGFFESL